MRCEQLRHRPSLRYGFRRRRVRYSTHLAVEKAASTIKAPSAHDLANNIFLLRDEAASVSSCGGSYVLSDFESRVVV